MRGACPPPASPRKTAWRAALAVGLACAACADPVGHGVSGTFTRRPAFADAYELAFAFGDCDDDGRLEAVRADGSLVDWDDRWAPTVRRIEGFAETERAKAVVMADVTGDGVADLVSAGDAVWLRRGLGACRFAAPVRLAAVDAGEPMQIFPVDADRDGLTDLLLGVREDPAGPGRLLLARGDGTYEELHVPPAGFHPLTAGPPPFQFYAALLDDADGDGLLDLFSFNDQGQSFFAWGLPGPAPSYQPDLAQSAPFHQSSPMALATLDYDRDGGLDYFVSNAAGTTDLLRCDGRGGWHRTGRGAGLASSPWADWGSYAFDADHDGWSDLLVLRTASADSDAPAPVGFFVNQGDGHFVDVAPDRLDQLSFGARRLVCGDVSSRGAPSCLVGDPTGTALLANDLAPTGHWVGVRLAGTVSSPDAVGARVFEEGEAPAQLAAYGLQSPTYGTHDPRLVFGLGARTSARLRVVWPSGLEQRFDALEADRYHDLVEPEVLNVSPRVAAADGRSKVQVMVNVVAAGTPNVTIERTGAGDWSGDAVLIGTTLRRWLVAPRTPGEARVVVSLAGHTLAVRPRLRFVAR